MSELTSLLYQVSARDLAIVLIALAVPIFALAILAGECVAVTANLLQLRRGQVPPSTPTEPPPRAGYYPTCPPAPPMPPRK